MPLCSLKSCHFMFMRVPLNTCAPYFLNASYVPVPNYTYYFVTISHHLWPSEERLLKDASFCEQQSLLKVVWTPTPFEIFLSPSLFCVSRVQAPPPSYNVESLAETLSYIQMHHFYLKDNSYLLSTTFFYGGGDFIAHK